MKCTILFLSEKNPLWVFVKPLSTVTDGIVDNYEGGWLQLAEAKEVGTEITLKNRYLKDGFWLRKGE